jgi:ubiquinone/menaquinone biosynthesis C-methylase UbiE
MLYQHPLAYLAGLEGVALLRAFAGEHDRQFVLARLAELRQLLDDPALENGGTAIAALSTAEGYRSWAPSYDHEDNALLDIEGRVVREIVADLPVGLALDAACGTGRHAAYLKELGHEVVGVDASFEMLSVARRRLPVGRLLRGELERLPLPDRAVHLVVCALALTHVADLRRALAEFVRVLEPGGHLVLSDSAGLAAGIRPPVVMVVDGRPGYLPHHNRRASEYLEAALPLGLEVRRCEEPRLPEPYADPGDRPSAEEMLVPGPPNIWSLHHWFPEATNAAMQGAALVWCFQRRAER